MEFGRLSPEELQSVDFTLPPDAKDTRLFLNGKPWKKAQITDYILASMIYRTVILSLFLSTLLLACSNPEKKGERLAKLYCASCHSFPDPSLLSKNIWKNGVFPEMKFRMGVDNSKLFMFSETDMKAILTILPDEAMVTPEEWTLIENYYLKNAPDTILPMTTMVSDTTLPFSVEKKKIKIGGTPSGTLIRKNSDNELFYGTRFGKIYRMNTDFMIRDSFLLQSTPSDIIFKKANEALVLTMGMMDPNDRSSGKIMSINWNDSSEHNILDSLKRPVQFEEADLNNDGLNDFIICAFGNYTGNLVAGERLDDSTFVNHVLQNTPGARRAIVQDFDNNGLKDILVLMAQGDEEIIMLYNQGKFKFRITRLLRFPPVYGSSYFDIKDFNGDGKFDILYTNGDNGDYSITLKPYHGIRIFLNDGTNGFKEDVFIPMHGASKAIANDFDNDGDLDIAAISFFPDFKNYPEQGFVYFENQNNKFSPRITREAKKARWIMMEEMDIDNDNDQDLVLVALNFPTDVPKSLLDEWKKNPYHFMVLRNNTVSQPK